MPRVAVVGPVLYKLDEGALADTLAKHHKAIGPRLLPQPGGIQSEGFERNRCHCLIELGGKVCEVALRLQVMGLGVYISWERVCLEVLVRANSKLFLCLMHDQQVLAGPSARYVTLWGTKPKGGAMGLAALQDDRQKPPEACLGDYLP